MEIKGDIVLTQQEEMAKTFSFPSSEVVVGDMLFIPLRREPFVVDEIELSTSKRDKRDPNSDSIAVINFKSKSKSGLYESYVARRDGQTVNGWFHANGSLPARFRLKEAPETPKDGFEIFCRAAFHHSIGTPVADYAMDVEWMMSQGDMSIETLPGGGWILRPGAYPLTSVGYFRNKKLAASALSTWKAIIKNLKKD